tara:strand:+ start:118843 stop:119943 length:1101 start_codon:yes stop_codon:yes gene_type:complete
MIYFLAHSDWILYNSRKEISQNLANQFGYKVNAITPNGDFKNKLEKYFSHTHLWEVDRLKLIDINGIKNLRLILKSLNENDILHIFTLKSGLYALFATTFYKKKFKIVLSITGLGYLFSRTFVSKLIRNILRFYMRFYFKKKIDILIFQNEMDKKVLTKYVKYQNKSYLIRGSGLKLSNFSLKNISEQNYEEIKIIMCCRLLKDKGINEYLQLAKSFQDEKYKFFLAGSVDLGNPASYSNDEIMYLTKESNIEYLGWIDSGNELKNYDISICMSYHEGLPRIVLESLYIGLYTISNKLYGLSPIFDKSDNGKLIVNNNQTEFIDAIEDFSKIENIKENALNSRKKISENFSTEKILKDFVEVYENL